MERRRERERTCVLELDLVEVLLVGLGGAGEDGGGEGLEVRRVLAGQAADRDLAGGSGGGGDGHDLGRVERGRGE
jgi:hypothetical protein